MPTFQQLIRKADGTIEPFQEEKLRSSLQHAHIPKQYHSALVKHVKTNLKQETPSSEIAIATQDFLNSQYPQGVCTYNLKHALMEIGPTGFPFEQYIAKLLQNYGHTTRVSQIVFGKCVSHEVDIIAESEKNGKHKKIMIECKYHRQGVQSDVKVALYVHARFQDILGSWQRELEQQRQHGGHQSESTQFESWLVTNTKCSRDAVSYARCVGLRILSWNYPKHGGLRDLVDEAGLYPVTGLCMLTRSQHKHLLERGIVLVHDLFGREDVLKEIGVPAYLRDDVMREAAYLCSLRE